MKRCFKYLILLLLILTMFGFRHDSRRSYIGFSGSGGVEDALLLETGDYLLLETGDKLLLE